MYHMNKLYCSRCRKSQEVKYEFNKPIVRQLLSDSYIEVTFTCGHKRILKKESYE